MSRFVTTQGFYKILCGIMLTFVTFIGSQLYTKIVQMQKDILDLKINITKIQYESLSKDDIKQIVLYEVQKQIQKYVK